MTSRQIVCVTAGQRSGTTALRSFISGAGAFADLGEVFDTAIMDSEQSYFGYCRDRKILLSDILSGPDAEKLCKGFIAELSRIAHPKHLLLDVKFNSWGEIRMPWTYMHQEPFFLSQLKWRSAKFIFVWRRDLVAQILSDRVSERVGKWHNLEASDAIDPFELDADKMRNRAALLCMSEKYFYNNLSTYAACVFLCYDDLFNPDGGLRAAARSAISGLVGEPLDFPDRSAYFKNRLDHRAMVSNYPQVVAAINEAIAEHRDPIFAGAAGA